MVHEEKHSRDAPCSALAQERMPANQEGISLTIKNKLGLESSAQLAEAEERITK